MFLTTATEAALKIFGLTLAEWGVIFAIWSLTFGGLAALIRYFRNSITAPLHKALEELSEDIKGFNSSRKENERKIFDVTDDHTKEIAHLQGAVNTLAVGQQSNTMRLDRVEKRMDK